MTSSGCSTNLQLPELPRRRNSDTPVTVSLQLEVSTHPPELLASLNELRQEAAFTDVALETDSGTLYAHKALLAAASPYFRAMFSNHFKESGGVVRVTSVSGDTLRLIVEYVYTSKIEITTDNAQDLTVGCKLLQFPLILQQCLKFLMHHVDSANCVAMEQFAEAYDFEELQREARERVLENFGSIAESEELAAMTRQQLADCLRSNELNVRSEDEVARAILRWVAHDTEQRVAEAEELMSGCRVSWLSRDCAQQLAGSPMLSSCQRLLQRLSAEAADEAEASCPRPSTLRREQLVVLSRDCLEVYNPAKDKWARVDFSGAFSAAPNSAACVLDNDIWLTGGCGTKGPLADTFRYCPVDNCWTPGPQLNFARSRHTCVCVRGAIIVMGGVGADARMCTEAEVLRLGEDGYRWEVAGQLPEHACRKEASATSLSASYIIEAGGVKVINGNTLIMNTLDQHLVTEQGVEYTGEYYVLPEKLRTALLAVIDHFILILSAHNGKFWCLQPTKKSVKPLPALLPEPKEPLLCCAVCDKRLYCIDRGQPHSVSVFDPHTNAWSCVRPPKASADIVHCVTLQL